MTAYEKKTKLLENAGYAYSIERLSYVNRTQKKIFSIEFVEDHDENELSERIHESSAPGGEWRFYFNSAPSDTLKRELSAILGQ